MKRFIKILSFTCAAAFALAAVSCGGNGNSSSGSSENKGAVQPEIYMPDGAPALSMAKFMAATSEGTENYHVVSASTIITYATGENPAADICVLPLNAASKQNIPDKYKLLGTATHGNLYMISDQTISFDKKSDLTSLIGKTVGIIQLANVPGLTFRAILEENNIAYTIIENNGVKAEDKVNLINVEATQILPTAAGGTCDVYIAAEPAVSTKISKVPALKVVGDLQKLYGDGNGYPQAVLVAKSEFVATNVEWVNDFMDDMVLAGEWLKTADASTVISAVQSHLTEGLTPTFNAENLTSSVIQNCGVYFTATDKEEINSFIAKYISINANAASVLPDSFFYIKGN